MTSKQQLFAEFETNGDPRITKKDSIVILSPFYWNYNFVTNFLLVIVAAYILTEQDDPTIDLFCILIVIGTITLIFLELRYYNTMTINILEKKILITPNLLLRIINREKVIRFDEIKRSKISVTNFWLAYRRHLITIVLKDSKEIKVISVKRENVAIMITKGLLTLLS